MNGAIARELQIADLEAQLGVQACRVATLERENAELRSKVRGGGLAVEKQWEKIAALETENAELRAACEAARRSLEWHSLYGCEDCQRVAELLIRCDHPQGTEQ